MKTYLVTGAALLLLTVLSYALSRIHIGAAEMPAAMVIAAVKVGLVVWFFMHLRDSGPTERLFAAGGAVMVAILMGIASTDVLARPTPFVP